MHRVVALSVFSLALAACGGSSDPEPAVGEHDRTDPLPGAGAVAYVDASIWDGTGGPVRANAALLVRDGRIEGIYEDVPEGAEIVSLGERWIVPGLINTHGHVSGRWAADDVTHPADRVRGDLALYARYGVTTVLSLGDEPGEAFTLRGEPAGHSRLLVAGEVVTDTTPEAASATAAANLARGVDWMKLRVDDNLGRGTKMPWDAVKATIDTARSAGVPVATHTYYHDNALRLIEMGSGLIAHSVRDRAVTDEFVGAMLESGVCYVPTLVR